MASGATPNLALPYPLPADLNNVPADIQALATNVENVFGAQGTLAARPAFGRRGALYTATDTSQVFRDSGTAWLELITLTSGDARYLRAATKTYRMVHTFTLSGAVAVPSGDTAYIPPFFVSLPGGQSAVIAGARHSLHTGGTATFTVSHGARDAGTAVTGLTGVVSSTTTTFTAATGANTVADGDAVQLVVTGIVGTPQNATVSVYLDVTV